MADGAINGLKVSQESKEILAQIAAEVNAAYRENFDSMLRSLQDIAEGQKRLLSTLGVLINAIEPKLGANVAAAVSIAMPGERPDIASTIVLADPFAAGYVLTQGELAKQVGLSQADVSILARAFRLDADTGYALRIPQGKRKMVMYRQIAGPRLRELIAAPPELLSPLAESTVRRCRAKLIKGAQSP